MNNPASTSISGKNITAFFVLTFIISLPFYILATLVPQEMVMLMAPILSLAPITTALILVYRKYRSDGAKKLLKRSFDYKRITRKIWYLPIFFLFPVIFTLALGVLIFLGEPIPAPILPIMAAPVAFLAFFIFALFEEVGWMGYAFDPMQGLWNSLKASLVLGILWAIWHIPFYIASDFEPVWIAGQLISMLAIRILISWIFNNTGKSVFATVLIHTVYNVCTIMVPSFYTSLGNSITSILIIISSVIVVFFWGSETLAQYRFRKKVQVY
ncbi:MAG: CPBP family intramembrane metalloprotease [Anaerolineales bacterium]|nr:CPBP family intramembrane metalloprotease [Anaerolineales bacterium]